MIILVRRAVVLVTVLFVAMQLPLAAAEEDSKRDIVILLDNHIFPSQDFHYDEAHLRDSIRKMLAYVRPQRVVAFAVGHDGHAQYPSKIFPPIAPSKDYPLLKRPSQDLLQIWREEIEKTNTKLIIYVSTLRNDVLAKTHPE